MRLDRLLILGHPGLSRRKAREVIEKGQVTVDGERLREAGRDVPETALVRFDPNRPALPTARCSLPVLYEDEHVIVVDKPAGLLTVPSARGAREEDTVLLRVREYARRLRSRGGSAERVHRLDRDTSGALVFALSTEARAGLLRTFRGHHIERSYLALVAGEPAAEQGEIDVPLREAWISGRKGVARRGEPARPALTRWRVLERLGGAALLEVRPETGRQHQIRVHLAHVGLSVLGDPVYGRQAQAPANVSGAGHPGARQSPAIAALAQRPMLHARRLAFAHPISGEPVVVESPLPEDMKRVLAALRAIATAQRRDPVRSVRPTGRGR